MNEAISFDTEVTSTYSKDNKKIAFMYCWMLDIFDCTIIGRKWSEFIEVMNIISNYYGLNTNKFIIIYIYNYYAYAYRANICLAKEKSK